MIENLSKRTRNLKKQYFYILCCSLRKECWYHTGEKLSIEYYIYNFLLSFFTIKKICQVCELLLAALKQMRQFFHIVKKCYSNCFFVNNIILLKLLIQVHFQPYMNKQFRFKNNYVAYIVQLYIQLLHFVRVSSKPHIFVHQFAVC